MEPIPTTDTTAEKITNIECVRLKELFDEVTLLVQNSPDTPELRPSSDDKLILYGLYKHATCGPCNGENLPSVYQVVARAKYQAWFKYHSYTREQAMLEYIQHVASKDHCLGEQVKGLLQQLDTSNCPVVVEQQESTTLTTERSDKVEHLKMQAMKNYSGVPNQTQNQTIPCNHANTTQQRQQLHQKSMTTTTTTTKGENSFWTTWAFGRWIACKPLIPRGKLDISYQDLFFALWHCCPSLIRFQTMTDKQIYKQSIASMDWNKNIKTTNDSNTNHDDKEQGRVMVGLSVKSLLDLFLCSKKYPSDSQIIVMPPISVPGMMHVLQYHNLSIVPIDIPSPNTIELDLQAMEAAITDKTVAIMIVHPFGMVTTSPDQFAQLRTIADRHGLDILEDCAECFTGFGNGSSSGDGSSCYLGSPLADVRFFSFGLIKTSTALGGGIAIIRNENIAQDVERLQQSLYKQQMVMEFLKRICFVFLLKFIESSPFFYGLLALLCKTCHIEFDAIVTHAVRGFRQPSSTTARKRQQEKRTDKETAVDQEIQCHLIPQIRKQPCGALLALLQRRLKQAERVVPSVLARRIRCQQLIRMLSQTQQGGSMSRSSSAGSASSSVDDEIQIPMGSNAIGGHSFWLFPIACRDRQVVQQRLVQSGFDVTHGASQLSSVSRFAIMQGNNNTDPCPHADTLMKQVLYLPVASRSLTKVQMETLVNELQHSSFDEPLDNDVETVCGKKKAKESMHSHHRHLVAFVAVLALIVWICFGPTSLLMYLSKSLKYMLVLSIVYVGCTATLLHILRRFMATFYLKSSASFAKYCGMIDSTNLRCPLTAVDATGTNRQESANDESDIFSQMDSLRIRQRELAPSEPAQKVLLTGATGFVGSLVLRDLLLHRKTLSLAGVLVLCRDKRGESAKSRIDVLLSQPIFDFLSREEKTQLVTVIEGDVTKPDLGLNATDIARIQQGSSISHVIHCAAAVAFTQDIPDAARANITSSLNLRALAGKLSNNCAKFVHISTAFVHGDLSGTEGEPLPEELFSLGPYDANKIFQSMLDTQYYASMAMNALRFPNTYTFSKCVCEHLLLDRSPVDVLIIRPSIVGPAAASPFASWAGEKPSTLVAAVCLYMSYQWNLWSFSDQKVPYIPVDVLSRFIIAKAFNKVDDEETVVQSETSSTDSSYERVDPPSECSSVSEGGICTLSSSPKPQRRSKIYNAAWNTRTSKSATFTWLDYAVTVGQLGAILGYFNRVSVYVTLLVTAQFLPHMTLTVESFETIHSMLVLFPMRAVMALCNIVGYSPKYLSKLYAFLDLPLLFFPFMNNSFNFTSDISPPESFDVEKYIFSCGVAAHRFMRTIDARRSQSRESQNDSVEHNMSSYIVGGEVHDLGSSDLWWALSQPRGNYILRLCGFIFIKILRGACSVVSVDVASFAQAMKSIAAQHNGPRRILVLAPTHRSFFDFLLLSYIFFAIPELQVDIPYIAAADDFEKLPFVGWFAPFLRAFYVKRGCGQPDPSLLTTLTRLKDFDLVESGSCLEVFLEGKRSRDRRFVDPKTGFLRCLKELGGDYAILPITISYEGIPEQSVLADEANNTRRRTLNVAGMIEWLKNVALGKIFIGKIHVEANSPVVMKETDTIDFDDVVRQIQLKQKEIVRISDYHVQATSKLLRLDLEETRRAFTQLGCKFWPVVAARSSRSKQNLELPDNRSELWTIMLQQCHLLSLCCRDAKPKWASWLDRTVTLMDLPAVSDPLIKPVVDKLLEIFDAADDCILKAVNSLKSTGFPHPNFHHILQVARSLSPDLPSSILAAAITISRPIENIVDSFRGHIASGNRQDLAIQDLHIPSRDESLGYWGFRDSGFVLRADKSGQPFVMMKGNRYSLCGKSLKRLLPFIESELEVQLNPLKESIFQCNEWWMSSPSQLKDSDVKLLEERVSRVSLSSVERARHGTGHSQEDVSALRGCQAIRIPDAVVWPSCETEVEDIVAIAKSKQWCLIPFGGGTNVSNATRCPEIHVESRPIISIDMTLMCNILWLNEEDGLAHVEAGMTGRDLVQQMERRGFTIGHEPDSIEFSTLGGWIATKASGMKRSKYGNIEDIVKSVRVVGATGLLSKGEKEDESVPGRVSEGLDLCSLMMGSEGCLGVITSAVVRVWPLPEIRAYDSAIFPDFRLGVQFMREVAKIGRNAPASVRLLDNEHFRLGQALRPPASFPWGQLQSTLMRIASYMNSSLDAKKIVCATISYEGSRDEVASQKRDMAWLIKAHSGLAMGSRVGKAGYDLTFTIAYLRDFAMTYNLLGESFETFVPWSKLEKLVQATKLTIVKEHKLRNLPGLPFVGCRVTQLYHEGACVYFYCCFNVEGVDNASEIFAEIEKEARSEILRQGGSVSHHHGLGKVRSKFLKGRSSQAFDTALASIKQGFDIQNVFGARNGPFSCEANLQ